MNFEQYLSAELVALIPLLNGIGFFLKNKTKLNNKWIPLILAAFGIVFSLAYSASTVEMNGPSMLTATVQGILLAASAVYANQLYKQFKE
jgi:hypothetical protein